MPDQTELIARAEALLPGSRERAPIAEENRRLSDETVQEFRDAEFHKILQPRQFGGFELGFDTAAEVIRTLTTACSSISWVANLFIVHNWQISLSGTGSKDLILDDIFVPEHRRVSSMDLT